MHKQIRVVYGTTRDTMFVYSTRKKIVLCTQPEKLGLSSVTYGLCISFSDESKGGWSAANRTTLLSLLWGTKKMFRKQNTYSVSFNWSPSKFPKYKYLYNLWHLEKL